MCDKNIFYLRQFYPEPVNFNLIVHTPHEHIVAITSLLNWRLKKASINLFDVKMVIGTSGEPELAMSPKQSSIAYL